MFLGENAGDSTPAAMDRSRTPSGYLQRQQSVSEAKLESALLPTDTVVKIHGTGVRPSYLIPWQVKSQKEWTGTGFVLTERRILTNAHVVEDATVLQVTKQDSPKKFRARAVCVAHDLDLAIVIVDEETFWEDLPTATLADRLPDLYSEVKAVGFPTGGSTVCVTKGVISRIDAMLYVHPQIMGVDAGSRNSPGPVILLQIDAAINPGNSGGPTFDNKGIVVGVASSGLPSAQNVGYIIPATIASMFVDEYARTQSWSGLSELGISGVPLENDSMRSFLKMEDQSGILVTDVAPLGALHGKVQPGDVLTHLDGHDVTNEGTVPLVIAGQKVYVEAEALVTQKAKGIETRFGILRDGRPQEVEVALIPIPPLAPRFHGYDCCPEYLLVGGIVFVTGCVPMYHDYIQGRSQSRNASRFISDTCIWSSFNEFKQDEDHELVCLLNILKHDVNLGYGPDDHLGILEYFNDQPVRNLKSLASMVGSVMRAQEEDFLRFRTRKTSKAADDSKQKMFLMGRVEGKRPDIVLSLAKVASADAEICKMNNIPAPASAEILPFFQGKATKAP
eukprot:TRINITY_DN28857_c0_g1_i1.p1 TRINITY_DN28857_c0_g1~~TRINITY_DN28857_c0_g1_i1.p1  ORF type:complete len:562 (-),score=94.41 TRINITY_DN28857_c0_g1_i1:120-1805(-)